MELTIPQLIDELTVIRKAIMETEAAHTDLLASVHPNYEYSARNLLRYLKLRTFDLRKLQEALSELGLSSIGNSERYVLAGIENILHFLCLHEGRDFEATYPPGQHPVNARESRKTLRDHTRLLFPVNNHDRNTKIMVTLPYDAVHYEWVEELLRSGMDVARINCSHDDAEIWGKMIANIHRAKAATGLGCAIYMDLSGPKIRTGDVIVSEKKKKKKIIDYIQLKPGDLLELHAEPIRGHGSKKKKGMRARISCSMPSAIADIKVGDAVWFDDGKIAARALETHRTHVVLEILRTSLKGGKLKAEKGINLPDTQLSTPSLTAEDAANLPFIVQHADIVGYSFVRSAEDVAYLQQQLKTLGREDIGIVLKIENRASLSNLPALLFQAMQSPNIGVMTARGDLAVEVGPERLSEAQEQIMWFCEAAFIPNIWATQVLESLAKGGLATRAEVTDAAMSARTECVMLNKGPFIKETVQTLIDILSRMEKHQYKRKGALRALKIAGHFFD